MFGFGNWGSHPEQTDASGEPKPKTWKDYARVVEDGLPSSERSRIADAFLNLRYANGHFDDADAARGGSSGSATQAVDSSAPWDPYTSTAFGNSRWEKADFRLYPRVMGRVVNELTKNLYKRAPTREFADKQIGAVVQELYQRNRMNALWQEADRFTAIGGYAAFQMAGSDDERKPVGINLWSADQLVTWTDPEDHTKPSAVFTLDKVDGRTRGTLWTEEKILRYTTRRGNFEGDQTRRFEQVGKAEDNPYRLPKEAADQGRGILPFSFCHWRQPATEFTDDCPGTNLRELNRYILHGLDESADGVRYLVKPIGVAEGVDEKWEPPAIVKPGMFLNLAAGQIDAGGNGPQPRLLFLTPDSGWVAVVWSHLNNLLDFFLEMEGVPPSSIRMILDARSGVSILAEQAPLLGWTEERRRPFLDYETSTAIKVLQVTAAHLRNHGRDARRFDEAALDPGLSLLWPRLYVDLPGPERDRSDGNRISWGMASLITIVQEREDCTREQALAKLKQVKDDNDELTALGIEPMPGALKPKAAPSVPSWGGGMDQIAAEGAPIDGEPVDPQAQADSLSQEGG